MGCDKIGYCHAVLQIEYGLEEAMNAYDEIGARELIGFLEGGIYEGNEYIYHYMRSINMDYVMLGDGKKAFRQLPGLLKRPFFYG